MTDTTQPVLAYLHQLLLRPPGDQPALAGLLAELAGVFPGSAVGVAALPDGQPLARYPTPATPTARWPWHDDPTLITRCRQSATAIVADHGSGQVVLTTAQSVDGSGWLLWLEQAGHRDHPDGQLAAFALVGQALARGIRSDAKPRWAEQLDLSARQDRLEIAAAVTRRLAHDFGNVLTGILGFTELALAQQMPANTSLHNYLQESYRAAQTGAQFTQQLRLFSRRQMTSSRSSQIAHLLAEQEARLFAIQPTGLNLRLTVPADLPPVALDCEQMYLVLTPILDNAREALVGPGVVSVSARLVEISDSQCADLYGGVQPGPHVEVIVADTGTGLSPDVQRRLFAEPFYSTKPKRRGFGLAIAYGVLHAHRGGIRLHPGEERGVVARIVLPVARHAPPPLMDDAMTRAAERSRGERILVVDDEAKILQVVAVSLEHAGYRVETFNNCESALQAYFAQPNDPYRLVLTDVVMPGMGGVDLVRKLLQRDPAVRVLFMSGRVSLDFTQPDFANRAFELLAKPFVPDQLTQAVRRTLDRPTAGRSAETAAPVRGGK